MTIHTLVLILTNFDEKGTLKKTILLYRHNVNHTYSQEQVLAYVQAGLAVMAVVQTKRSDAAATELCITTVVVVVVFTLTDRASTIPSNIRGMSSVDVHTNFLNFL